MISVSVVLPTFRKKDSIPPMLRALDALNLPGLEVIVADDHSPDGTEAAALETAKTSHTPVRTRDLPVSRHAHAVRPDEKKPTAQACVSVTINRFEENPADSV